MKASIKIGIMALMVMSMFNGVALADPIVGGGDAGNSASAASRLDVDIPRDRWELYAYATLSPSDTVDWYQLNTLSGEYLNYQLDLGNYQNVEQRIADNNGNLFDPSIAPINTGKTKYTVSGPTKSRDILIPGINVEYMFAMMRTLT